MIRKLVAALGLMIFTSFAAQASLIQIEKVDAHFNSANIDMAAYWRGVNPADVTTDMIDIATMLYNGSANNFTLFKMTVDLVHNLDFTFSLFAGLDAGHGAEIYKNDELALDQNNYIWWARNWTHPHVITLEDIHFDAGANKLIVYWAENINSGGNSFEYSINSGDRFLLSNANLRQHLTNVPEPHVFSFFVLLSLCLMAFRKRS